MKLTTRWVNKKNFARLGMVTGSLLVITTLITMIIKGFVLNAYSGGNILAIILDAITLLFYFIVLNNYRRSEDNLFFGYYASLLIIISDFIFPLIMNLVQGVFNFMLIIPSLSLIAVVVYFVFLTIENKTRTPKACTNLKIAGIVAGVVMLASGIQGFYLIFSSFKIASGIDYLVIIVNVINQLANTVLLPLIFAFYPFVLAKERYL